MKYIQVVFFASIVFFCTMTVGAQSARPADVLIVVETARAHLEQLYTASGIKTPNLVNLNLTPRRPRHVYQKGREVFLKAQMLRRINGLPKNTLPEAPKTEIVPGDVRGIVLLTTKDIEGLLPKYWIAATTKEPRRRDSATPTDVYQALHTLSQLLDGLGIPPVVPNDVHGVARRVNESMQAIYLARTGSAYDASEKTLSSGKFPADVYGKAFELLTDLNTYTSENENAAIPGGITMPNRQTSGLNPAAVMELSSNIAAELHSLKVLSGAEVSTTFQTVSSGMNPSNVFDELAHAHTILKAMR